MPYFDFKLETPEPASAALVKVTGRKLNAEVVQTELARLTRAEWNWEALPHGKDFFLVFILNAQKSSVEGLGL